MNLRQLDTLFLPNNHSDPHIRYRPITPEVKQSLLPAMTAFGWPESTIVQELDRPQLNSRNFRVTTPSGEWLMRQSLSPHSRERARLEHAVMRHCQQLGVATPLPLLTLEGDPFLLTGPEPSPSVFTVAEFVSGQHYSGTADELKSAAREIAKLSKALASFPGVNDVSVLFTFLTAAYSAELLESLGRLATDDSPLAQSFQHNRALIAESVKFVSEHLPHDGLATQLLHGDLHPHNFLMSQGHVCAILDYGEMRFGPQIEDLAYSLYRLVRQSIVHERLAKHQELGDTLHYLSAMFLSEYSSINSISASDQSLISVMIKHIALKKIFHVLTSHYLHGNPRWDSDFEKHLIALHEANYFE